MDTADALASKAHIDALAARLRTAGIDGTLGTLRVRVLAELTQGRDPLDLIRAGSPATGSPAPAPDPGLAPGPDPRTRTRPRPGRRTRTRPRPRTRTRFSPGPGSGADQPPRPGRHAARLVHRPSPGRLVRPARRRRDPRHHPRRRPPPEDPLVRHDHRPRRHRPRLRPRSASLACRPRRRAQPHLPPHHRGRLRPHQRRGPVPAKPWPAASGPRPQRHLHCARLPRPGRPLRARPHHTAPGRPHLPVQPGTIVSVIITQVVSPGRARLNLPVAGKATRQSRELFNLFGHSVFVGRIDWSHILGPPPLSICQKPQPLRLSFTFGL